VAPTKNLEAYNLCLLGRHYWNRWTEADVVRSTDFFSQSIEKDPGYAEAHCDLGIALATLALGYWSLRPLDVFPKAATSLIRAIDLDPGLARAHAWNGLIEQWFKFDWSAAETSFRRALELDPNSANAHDSFGWWLTSVRRHEEARAEYAKAMDLDPLSLFITCNAALGAYRARDYPKSVDLFAQAVSLDPNLPMGHALGSLAHIKNESPKLALEAAEQADLLSRGATPFLAMRAYVLGSCGEGPRARELLGELEARREKENVWLFGIGMAQASLGEHDLAFKTLNEAVSERSGWITYMAVEPGLDGLRDDPRFTELLERVGLGAGGRG
jgi:Tfp pilus assembly protein PilF